MTPTLARLKLPAILVVAWVGAGLTAVGVGAASPPETGAARGGGAQVVIPRTPDGLCGGEPCDAVLRGLFHFFDGSPDGLVGNGRSCGDCHMVTDHFQLSPANAERRFQLLQWRRRFNPQADDPLFRPIDADDFRTNGDGASDYSNLRENGLVRVVFDLPGNIKLVDPATNAPSAETVVDLWRAVPTVNDVKLTGPDGLNPWPRGPNPSGGYQLDARVTTLQDQALGALTKHAQVQNGPAQQFLDDLHSFQRVLFTNARVRALSEAIDAGTTPLPDPDPPLDELEQQGKVVFIRACAHCHGGPGQAVGQPPVVRYHGIGAPCPRPVDTVTPPRFAFAPCPPRLARNARTYEITLANGTTIRRTTSDPGRALSSGFVTGTPADDWGSFDVPAMRGISKTAPYFHNNSAATLEELVDHYIELFKRARANAPPGQAPPFASTDGVHHDRIPSPEERPALLAYLRKL
jgi:mono/diheme cytochrome c family protein